MSQTHPTHSLGVNGTTWMLVNWTTAADSDQFAQILNRVDGDKFYSLILWKLPDGKELDDTDPDKEANEYMQCAGSAARMTVEVRRIRGGEVEHFVVGHPSNGRNHGPKQTILWDSSKTIVAANEVFTAAETARLFDAYYRTGWVPSNYMLRPISV